MVDSHCHLADEAFENDLDAVIGRARAAGVTDAVCVVAAGDDEEAEDARVVHAAWDAVRFATGVHPHSAGPYVGRALEAAAITRAAAGAFRACAIGEIGLDYHYDFAPRDVQREVFAAQLDLARELGLPIVVHTREATDDTFALLAAAPGVRGVFHCFTGDAALARRVVEIGFYVSFAGIVTFPKAGDLRDAAAIVPADRLLIETDSPYLAPVPHRGKRNEPSFVGQVLATLATVRGEDPRTLELQVTENFRRFFLPSHVG